MIKCPHCGADMPEEALFCESCGKERQLVPDYEAEVNQSMEETISTIAVELANTQEIVPQELARDAVIREQVYKEKEAAKAKAEEKEAAADAPDPKEAQEALREASEKTSEKKAPKKKSTSSSFSANPPHNSTLTVIMLFASVTVVLLAAVMIAFFMNRSNTSTYDYQISQAKLYESQGDFEQMLSYARKAGEIASNSSDAKMLTARAYAGLGRKEEERIVLEGLVITDPAYTEAYDLLIPLYEESREYEKIAQTLLTCPDQSVMAKYADYIAETPQFSMEPGQYTGPVSVKLLATGSGTIYYTVDGSEPTTKSSVYTTPLILEEGKVKIRAVYQNSFGIVSEESQAEYDVVGNINTTAGTPEVLLEPATYTRPQVITCKAPSENYTIYYTSNGQDPGLDSREYDRPIPLPIGPSTFKFALFDQDGNPGEIITCHYQLNLELPLSQDQAKNLLVQALVSAGVLADAHGSIVNGEGRRSYQANSAFEADGQVYYLLEEYFENNEGEKHRTGNLYGVSVVTGQSYGITESADGKFSLSGI